MATTTTGSREDERLARRHADLLRSERTMVWVRAVAVLFALFQVLTYGAVPYPPGYLEAALGFVIAFAVVDLVAFGLLLARWPRDLARARVLAVATVTLDAALASGLVWAYSFDPDSAHWALLFVVPLVGAARFQLAGALATWAAVTVLYIARQAFAATVFTEIGFSAASIGFRMGLAFLVALVAGLLARDLRRERDRVAEALAEVEHLDALRARLVDGLAHDMRSPLTVIAGSLRALSATGDAGQAQRTLLALAERQTARLSRLATGMLDLAKLEQGRLVLDTTVVQLAPVVDGAVAALADVGGGDRGDQQGGGRGDQHGDDGGDQRGHGGAADRHDDGDEVLVDVAADLAVRGDPDRIDQIVYNLVANALRHGRPPVLVTAASHDDDVVLEVRDHGDGVPEALHPTLFDAFATASRGGVGLGLWLVRALAEAHGGSVAYDAAQPGARFVVTLPLASAVRETSPA